MSVEVIQRLRKLAESDKPHIDLKLAPSTLFAVMSALRVAMIYVGRMQRPELYKTLDAFLRDLIDNLERRSPGLAELIKRELEWEDEP